MRWRLYYGDGTTYSDRDGSPYDAPPANLQVLAREAPTPTGFELVHGTDAYYWHVGLGMWQGCDVPGLWDHLFLHRGPKVVLFGRTARDADFWALVARAGREGLG